MQTILGSGGAIGTDLARELKNFTDKVRLVSRNPKPVNTDDELYPADLTRLEEVERAVEGSEVAYLTVGFEYKLKIWQEKWPLTMSNVISACSKYKTRLVFFDNVYMYDPAFMRHMTEDTPDRPVSRKGKIRKEVADMVLQAIEAGNLEALIARSADFYGPKNSVLVETVFNNLKKGKKANWLVDADKVHNFTFTLDAARATAILGNTSDAYGQVWHLPTDKTRMTGKDWVDLIARELKVKPDFREVSPFLISLAGLFSPVMKELKEMLYQYDRDYFFDSSKFEKRFQFNSTSPQEGVRWLIENV